MQMVVFREHFHPAWDVACTCALPREDHYLHPLPRSWCHPASGLPLVDHHLVYFEEEMLKPCPRTSLLSWQSSAGAFADDRV